VNRVVDLSAASPSISTPGGRRVRSAAALEAMGSAQIACALTVSFRWAPDDREQSNPDDQRMTASSRQLQAPPSREFPTLPEAVFASIPRQDTVDTKANRRARPGAADSAAAHAFYRVATDPDYFGWINHVQAAAGCAHPVRLSGEIAIVEKDSGRVTARKSTQDMPDAVIYKPCGNRRATVCASCAETYRRDAYQLVRTGLVGGRGVPQIVATNPAVFATFTAPGFGYVHTRRTSRGGRVLSCRPRRQAQPCPHGVDMSCGRTHRDDGKALGQPLCLDCYDYRAQVIWNRHAGELWRRTTIAITRQLRSTARARGVDPKTIRVSYGKVAEMQRRGVVHFHAIIRLDGTDPSDPETILPAPLGFDVNDLVDAIAQATTSTAFITDPHPTRIRGWRIGWGIQLDIRPITVGSDGEITDGQVAGYLAKYATKSTETTGHLSGRVTADTVDLYANPDGTHTERLIDACWTLSASKKWRGLRRWAHRLGFGGHFLTKSRRYSVTFRILRDAHVIWRRTEGRGSAADDNTLVIGLLRFAGSGWHSTGDALLANTTAAASRERRTIAREEIAYAA
jgi:hypothetical protein